MGIHKKQQKSAVELCSRVFCYFFRLEATQELFCNDLSILSFGPFKDRFRDNKMLQSWSPESVDPTPFKPTAGSCPACDAQKDLTC